MVESKRIRSGDGKPGGQQPMIVRLPVSRGADAAAPVVISPRESRLRHVAAIVDATWRRRPAAIMQGWKARRPVTGPMRRWWSPIGDGLMALLDGIARWQERAESRHLLLTMDDRTLRDIGIDRATARHTGGLPFWRE
jgi:uncharacterized protein YjiS (DUF1127 family)